GQWVYATIHIEITQGVEVAVPIAIVPFQSTEKNPLAGALHAQITQDLNNSGRFHPVETSELPQTDLQRLGVLQWKHLGIPYVLLAQVKPVGPEHYDVSVQLLDVYHPQSVGGNDAADYRLFDRAFPRVRATDARGLAHHISDLVYEAVMGIPGLFSTSIAYVHVNKSDPKKLYYSLEISDMDGANPRPVVRSGEPILSPTWSPDGRWLAYVAFQKHRAGIDLLEVATGHRRRLTHFPGINGAPAFSPDGKSLALALSKSGALKLYLFDLATQQLTQLTEGYAIDTEPRWAPDGLSLFFTSNRGGKPQIYRLWLANKTIERVTFEGDYNARASITSDGQAMVMIHRGADGVFRIARQDLRTGKVRILTDKWSRLDESPTLAPNGDMILYATYVGDHGILAG
ncbi:Tol-Pal system beta propeller repeat protein TolB, partial [bacterium]|nr:Tol-Pal system beta propeller repeat protein TolB [bacterium]